MGALREILARFDIEVDPKGALKKGTAGVDGLAGKLGQLGSVLGGIALVSGIKNFVSGLAQAGDQIIDTSAQLGLGTEDFQRWGLAAKLSGVEAGTFAASVKKLQLNAAEASKSGAETGGIFAELGVSLRDGAGGPMRETTEIMYDAGIAISELADPIARTKAMTEVFGKAGAQLGPMFAKGEEGLQGLLEELDKLGGGYSKEALEQMGELGDQTDRFEFALTSLKGSIALAVLPTINKLISEGAKLVGFFKNSEGATTKLKVALGLLGAAAAAAAVRALLPWAPFALMIAGTYLIVEDLIIGLQGGESAAGLLLDKILGKGAGKSIFKEINADLKSLGDELKNANGLAEILEKTFSKVGGSLTKFFVEELPGAIGVATKEMTGADTTWKQLFETAADRETRERDERISERAKLQKEAIAGNGTSERVLQEKLAAAEKEKAKWDSALGGMDKEQRRTFDSKNIVAGVTNPAELWQENIDGLKASLQRVSEGSGTRALLGAQGDLAGNMNGYATSRVNEEYGTRTENTNTVQVQAPVTINVADAETAATVAGGFFGGVAKRGIDAALRTQGADK